jgi:hypothetical protein
MRREWGIGLLFLAGSSVLIWNCWNAQFLGYDDVAHIHLIPQIFGQGSILDLFKPPRDLEYLPVTILSYRFDYVVFGQWMQESPLHNWAFAVRMMSCVYHALAAYMVMRILLEIGVTRGAALFAAFVFVVHPTACESVCWASERKNILAGTFGFAALWVYVAFEGRRWRLPLTLLLYLLANLSKPSALGLMPVLALFDLFGGRAGLRGEALTQWKPSRARLAILGRSTLFGIISIFILAMNMLGTKHSQVPPPGGTLFTAALTDVEILARYLFALFIPLQLSFAYYVEPITTLLSARLWTYGAAITGVVALTIWLAENRRRATFGWLWALAALVPSLNFVAITHPMQDRYLYLSFPGVFLAVVEAGVGLAHRIPTVTASALRIASVCFVAGLAILSVVRGADYTDEFTIFSDAARKQPLSANAHLGVMYGYLQGYDAYKTATGPGSEERLQRAAELHQKAMAERRVFLERCPDVARHFAYAQMSVEEGQDSFRAGDIPRALHYLEIAAHPAPGIISTPKMRAAALRDLSMVRLAQHTPAAALALVNEALEVGEEADRSRFVKGKVELTLAAEKKSAGDAGASRALIESARADLKTVPEQSEVFASAQELLKQTEAER